MAFINEWSPKLGVKIVCSQVRLRSARGLGCPPHGCSGAAAGSLDRHCSYL